MRSYQFLLITVALIFCLHSVAAVPHILAARQDDSSSSNTPARTDADVSPASSTDARQSSAAKTQSDRSSTPATSTSVRVTASTSVHVPVTTTSNEPLPSTSADANSTKTLPIQPAITPAWCVLGVVLLVSGVAYTVIGIKNKWLYISFSAAYLSSLAATVLIVYLMADSVSRAIQGAFFVAAFLTGIIFGALALVFSDITEGLGTLLGGFCLSMWFLALKEGGLITSTTGRAIFISAMSLAGFCLSFSHHTRTYGLIVSISFAGATAIVLGIDCFSRAGLKEFWLYLWDLNPGIFPLFTDTYPITKGMRAELACIILFCFFGIISQLKLWKIVKESREKNAASRIEHQQQSALEEESLGRRIEDNFAKERAQWEATYGDKSQQQDSGVGSSVDSSSKSSSSLKEKRNSVYNSVEMVPLSKNGVTNSVGKKDLANPTVTISVLEEDDIQSSDHGNPIPMNKRLSSMHSNAPANNRSSPRASFDVTSLNGLPRSISTRSSLHSSVPPPPVVVPLPFRIPQEDEGQSEQGENDSVYAAPESVRTALSKRQRLSGRVSGSALRRFSTSRNSPYGLDFEEAMMIPHVEDDRSSLAATLDGSDDVMSLPEFSPPQSQRHSMMEEQLSTTSANKPNDRGLEERTSKEVNSGRMGKLDVEEKSQEEEVAESVHNEAEARPPVQEEALQSLTISTDPKNRMMRSERSSLNSPVLRVGVSTPKEDGKSQPTGSTKSGAPSINESHTGGLYGALPDKLSKVALSYRTNEWAKHLEAAEKPETDDLVEPGSPGVKLDHNSGELPVPVNDEMIGILASKTNSRRVSTENNIYRNSNMIRSTSNFSRTSQLDSPYSLSGLPSTFTSAAASPSGVASQQPQLLSPRPSNTLMGKRESLVRNRVSTQSFAPSPSSSSPKVPVTVVEQEDMTLAQRRRRLQQQKAPVASQQWQQGSRALQGQVQDFNSHQPRRTSGLGHDNDKREVLLANWRESIRQDSTVVENRRVSMMNERQKRETEKQQREKAKQQRESMMDNMARSGNYLEAHRDAMRRMQAAANKRL